MFWRDYYFVEFQLGYFDFKDDKDEVVNLFVDLTSIAFIFPFMNATKSISYLFPSCSNVR